MSLPTDFRSATRSLTRQPGAALLIVLTLALGIGANTAIFSIVNGVLLKPLPYASPDRIVFVQEFRARSGPSNTSPANFLDLRRESHAFDRLAAVRQDQFDYVAPSGIAHWGGAHVTEDFFDVFGVQPLVGHTWSRGDRGLSTQHLLVLSHAVWRQYFNADPAVVGRPVRLSDVSYTIAGVMPAGFAWPDETEVWALSPLGVPPSPIKVEGDLLQERGLNYFDVIGRLKPGVTLAQGQADASAIGARLARQFPESNEGDSFLVRSLLDFTVGDVRQALLVLLASVGVVLLIACANIANLLVARAASRRREIAVRAALGAGRWRLLRLFLLETSILALAGTAVAALIAWWSLDALRALLAGTLPRASDIAIDYRVAAFTGALTIVAALLCGLAPLLYLRGGSLLDALKSATSRGASAAGGTRLRQTLVVAEIALAVVLLVAAALMANSLWRLTAVDPGIRTAGITAVQVVLPETRYADLPQQADFYGRVLAQLQQHPGVASATVTFPLPLSGGGASATFDLEGRRAPSRAQQPHTLLTIVSPSYFRTLGVPVLRGRALTDADRQGAPSVALVNRAFVTKYLGTRDPIGAGILLGGEENNRFGIVGVVGDFRRDALDRPPEPIMFLSYRQLSLAFMHVLVRPTSPDVNASALVRDAVTAIDRSVTPGETRTLEEVAARSTAGPRFRATVLGIFAGVALVLAWVGVYGVLSQSVAQRTRELGVRIAVGAQPSDVYRLVFGEGLRLAAIGLAIGTGLAVGASRALAALLYDVAPTDVPTFAIVVATLVAASALATVLPARRATRVDPIEVLRAD